RLHGFFFVLRFRAQQVELLPFFLLYLRQRMLKKKWLLNSVPQFLSFQQ
ncbi:YusE, partial [Listeria seeligeri FSL N1-067]